MFNLWENSRVTDIQSGWQPVYFFDQKSFAYAYIKTHSYGEYIFDWAWADLFQRYQIPYYPKLVQALPVTPISAPKFINPSEKLYQEIYDFYQREALSSHHILFTDRVPYFIDRDYFYQKTMQFHFINRFDSYDDFLEKLKSRKRKNIQKERKEVSRYPVEIKKISATQLSQEQKEEVFQLYLSTILKKYSQAYLTQDFFINLNQGFYYLAYFEDQIIAMSLFFEGEKVLYGRYWGIHPRYEAQFKFLHFEMCYYLGIEHTINQKYLRFEAGAQGEQKLFRGFTPVEIGSLHHIKQPQFREAIKNHIEGQNQAYEREIQSLKSYLPFKE